MNAWLRVTLLACGAVAAACTNTPTNDDDTGGGGSGTPLRDAGFVRPDAGAAHATSGIATSQPATSGPAVSQAVSQAPAPSSRAGSSSRPAATSAAPSSRSPTGSSAARSSSSRPAGTSRAASSSLQGGSSVGVSSSAGQQASSSASAASSGAPVNAGVATVWVHSPTVLYLLKNSDLSLEAAWSFVFLDTDGTTAMTGQEMVDIAVNTAGQMYGISWDPAMLNRNHLYRVSLPTTVGTGAAWATRVGQLTYYYYYNSLSFAPAGTVEAQEVLVALDRQDLTSYLDEVSTTDATTVRTVGGLKTDYWASGDIIAVVGMGLYATVKNTAGNDILAQVNPSTGVATLVGSGIGFDDVYGLAYVSPSLLGFTFAGDVITLSTTTGVGTPRRAYAAAFYGATVSPAAPYP